MIRTATKDQVACIAQPLWLLINQCRSWDDRSNRFEPLKCAVLALVSQLAYCTATEEERHNPHRARVVPCGLYQKVVLDEGVDVVRTLAQADFPDATVVSTRRFVSILIRAGEKLFIGIRGTQFAYDWAVNLKAWKRERLHAGFQHEASELAGRLSDYLKVRDGASARQVFITGHSLGGAIAAILNVSLEPQACYTFASPRIGGASLMQAIPQPRAVRRTLDIVPRVPPTLLGYSDFLDQSDSEGNEVAAQTKWDLLPFAQWILTRAFGRFVKNHSMNVYCYEALRRLPQRPDMQRYWTSHDSLRVLRELQSR